MNVVVAIKVAPAVNFFISLTLFSIYNNFQIKLFTDPLLLQISSLFYTIQTKSLALVICINQWPLTSYFFKS